MWGFYAFILVLTISLYMNLARLLQRIRDGGKSPLNAVIMGGVILFLLITLVTIDLLP